MRRLVLVASLALALSGCAGHDAGRTTAAQPSASPVPPVPSSTWVSPYDAKVMLARDAPLADLREELTSNLKYVDTLRVEIHELGSVVEDGVVTLDVDYSGNCSGTVLTPDGVTYQVIKRGQRLLTTTDEGTAGAVLDGRWVSVHDGVPFTEQCDGGAASFVDLRTVDTGGTWLLLTGKKVGMEKVRGKSALHVHQHFDGTDWDVWVAAFVNRTDPSEHELYPVKISSHSPTGDQVRYFSRFNQAKVATLPSPDEIIDPGRSQA